jgi:hypothetical protein
MLRANDLLTPSDQKWIKQDVAEIFSPVLGKVGRSVTYVASFFENIFSS